MSNSLKNDLNDRSGGEQGMQQATRRGFFQQLSVWLAFLATLLPARLGWSKKVGIPLSMVPELEQIGGSRKIPVKGLPILFVRDSETTVAAVSPVCTHKKCEVRYDKAANHLKCKCHKSTFELDGSITKGNKGPAKLPLPTYLAQLQGDKIIVDLPDT